MVHISSFASAAISEQDLQQGKPANLLIVPGYRGSGPQHWQTWLQSQVPYSVRVDGIDWDRPVLAAWSERVRAVLARASEPQLIVAHSFGCLAAVVAAADRPERVAQLILVAPADPERFEFTGLRSPQLSAGTPSVSAALPNRSLQVPGCIIASRNDAWLEYAKAAALAEAWSLDLIDAGAAGHINPETGFGTWPLLLHLLASRVQQYAAHVPLSPASALKKGRGSTLAAVRQFTRSELEAARPGRRRE